MVHIKRAGVSDAAVISFLGQQTFTETFGHLFTAAELNKYLDDTFNIQKLQSSLLKPHNIFGVLYHAGITVGYYEMKLDSCYGAASNLNHVQLRKIYMLKDYANKKFGIAMLEDILGLKEIKDCTTIWLVVLHTNARAVKFYESNGFKKLADHYYTIGQHDLAYDLMVKNMR